MDLRKTHTIILDQGDPEQKRGEILEYFHATFGYCLQYGDIMNIHDIVENISGQTELPAILFALRLGGPRRRSYCRPKFNYEISYAEKKPPGFIGSHPVFLV